MVAQVPVPLVALVFTGSEKRRLWHMAHLEQSDTLASILF